MKFLFNEFLKSLHAYPSQLLNFFGILLFSNSGFRVIDRQTLRNLEKT